MPIIPLYGHQALRERLASAVARGTLPASLLLHGPAGVGKQRLGLWLGQLLLCEQRGVEPCGRCTSCRYALELAHPDLHWYFPRPRPKNPDQSVEDVKEDYTDAITERLKSNGLYPRPGGMDALFVHTVRTIVQQAALTPVLGRRKVFVIGDAERMTPQADDNPVAANAFLKLLEEPPSDTTIVITSSEPGALLPTIRSRVVSLRASPLRDQEMRAFADDPAVGQKVGRTASERLANAGGLPGALVSSAEQHEALEAARAFLGAVLKSPAEQYQSILRMGGAKARGFFSDMLDALTVLIHEQGKAATERGDTRRALGASQVLTAVEEAKLRASGNVNPQLISAALARTISEQLG